MQSHQDLMNSAYAELYEVLEYAFLVSDLQMAKPFIEKYLALAMENEFNIDTAFLYQAYTSLLSLLGNPENQAISFYGDIVVPVEKFQLRYQELSKTLVQSESLGTNRLFQPAVNKRALLDSVLNFDFTRKVSNVWTQLEKQSPGNAWKSLLQKTSGKELCGTTWHAISPLEFVVYIGDIGLRRKMLSCIPLEGYEEAVQQMQNVEKNGLENRPRYAPFLKFIEACEGYPKHVNKSYDDPDGSSIDKFFALINEYCIKVIGGAQSQLSCFGLQWLCGRDLTSPDGNHFVRSPERKIQVNGEEFSFADSGLGESCFLYRTDYKMVYSCEGLDPLAINPQFFANSVDRMIYGFKTLIKLDTEALEWDISVMKNGLETNKKIEIHDMQIGEELITIKPK